jgi:hypothetical protein
MILHIAVGLECIIIYGVHVSREGAPGAPRVSTHLQVQVCVGRPTSPAWATPAPTTTWANLFPGRAGPCLPILMRYITRTSSQIFPSSLDFRKFSVNKRHYQALAVFAISFSAVSYRQLICRSRIVALHRCKPQAHLPQLVPPYTTQQHLS